MADPSRSPLDPSCACGRGQHLLDCCGACDGEEWSEDERSRIASRVMKFGERPEFASSLRRAGKSLQVSADLTGIEEFLEQREEQVMVMLANFLFYDLPIRASSSLAGLLLQREGRHWPARERAYLAQMASQPISLFEVVDVFPGKGMELRDVFRGFVVRVKEKLASTQAVPGWHLLTRVRLQPDGVPVLDAPPVQFEADAREPLLEVLKSTEGQALVERSTGAFRSWQEYMASQFAARHAAIEGLGGGEFGSYVLQLEIVDESEFLGALASCDGWESQKGLWIWIEPDDIAASFEDLGFAILHLSDGQGIVVVDSEATADAIEELFDSIPGVEVVGRIEGENSDGIERARALVEERSRVRRLTVPLPDSVDPAAERDAIRRELDRYYRSWSDESIPEFGGRSPREMAKVDPHAVSRMLWTLEYPKDPKLRFEMGWMYRELGVRQLGESEFEAGVDAQGS